MPEDLFAIMARLPMLAEAMQNYKSPEELDREALAYVRSKWRNAEMEDVYSPSADVLGAMKDEAACAKCEGKCPLNYHPRTLHAERLRDKMAYVVRVGNCRSSAAQNALKGARIEDLIKASGLTPKQQKQTFETYATKGLGADVSTAKGRAMLAAEDGSWLVLAGKQGTGKSHLAVAVMLRVMERRNGALFRSVPEMLDELRLGNEDYTYHAKIKQLKDAPCLILDDLGKERNTGAGLEYLFNILDFRYRHERQTIVTTNALDQGELASWKDGGQLVPILSRLNEMGAWCAIRKAGDYRSKLAESRKIDAA